MKVMESFDFTWQDIMAPGRKKPHQPESIAAAKRAWEAGMPVIKAKGIWLAYAVQDLDDAAGTITLQSENGHETLYIGEKAGYLAPAKEVFVAVNTVGNEFMDLMASWRDDMMGQYYLDVFGVKALGVVSAAFRAHVEAEAAAKGWGAGPSMQPGSLEGWPVQGQNDLVRLSKAEEHGVSINASSMMSPVLSNSSIAGIGPHYSSHKVDSLCHECKRYASCLWRRENI